MSQRIGVAFSGGGFRATAFGLGALRAMHDRGMLQDVRVVSGISGGSLLAALWAYGPVEFERFDEGVVELLRHGLQAELLRRSLSPASMFRSTGSAAIGSLPRGVRRFSRTESLVEALMDRGLNVTMEKVTHAGLETVLSATDLATSNAVRFGSRVSSSSPLGVIEESVLVADAVAASAAFPLLLPALVRSYNFRRADGTRSSQTVSMTDGGVYDNLGVTPLLPGRSQAHTSHVYDIDQIIAVDAGAGRGSRTPARGFLGRVKQTFEISHSRVQDGARSHLHLAAEDRKVAGIAHIYLGMRDSRIPPVTDLVPVSDVNRYPTNFAAMDKHSLSALTIRGEQLARVMIAHYLR